MVASRPEPISAGLATAAGVAVIEGSMGGGATAEVEAAGAAGAGAAGAGAAGAGAAGFVDAVAAVVVVAVAVAAAAAGAVGDEAASWTVPASAADRAA